MKKANKLNYSKISEGDVYSFSRVISRQDVLAFAELSGDFNPLHVDKDFGKKSEFKANLVHGMLASSLFSTLVGMRCPGEKSLYISQTLNFKLPIYCNERLTVRGTVISKSDSTRLITLKTEILKGEKIAVFGEAKVKVME
jgi:acyl dehydratase